MTRSERATAGVMAAVLCAVVAAPLALEPLVPEQPRGRIGVFERVSFAGDGAYGGARAGIIAPAGWHWVESRESGLFLSEDRAAFVSVELRTGVADPEALLRQELPLGAAASPVSQRTGRAGLRVRSIEYDLAAGDSPASGIAVCTAASPHDCLFVFAAYGEGDEAGRDRAERGVRALVDSAEILS